MSFRTFLSPPDLSRVERPMSLAAVDSDRIPPVTPDRDAFEAESARGVDRRYAVEPASGEADEVASAREVLQP
jgi:hypothetical protein